MSRSASSGLAIAVVLALLILPTLAFGDEFSASTTQSPPNPVPAGTTVTYTTTIINTSGTTFPSPAEQPFFSGFLTLLRRDMPAPNSYASFTGSQGTCTPDPTTIPQSVNCDFGTLPPGASVTYTSTAVAQVSMTNNLAVVSCTSSQDCATRAAADIDTTVLQPCVVPDVRNRTLPSVKRRLAKHNCALGKVTRKHSRRAKNGRVIRQRPAPGRQLANGGKVAVVLGKG